MPNQVPLSIFPFTDPFILLIGYKSPAVFAVLWIELSSISRSLSPTEVVWIKSVLLGGKVGDYLVPNKMMLKVMSRYTSPVNLSVFPHLNVVLFPIGMFFTSWFFVYEVISTKYTQDIYKELLISLGASLFTGFGVHLPAALDQHLHMSSQEFQPDSFTKTLSL